MEGQELDFNFEQNDEEKPSRRLPNPVTTPRKGPLALHVHTNNAAVIPQAKHNMKSHAPYLYTYNLSPKRGQLNRFPIPNLQRPIDQIEEELGDIMCSEIGDNIHLISEWNSSRRDTKRHIPALHPMLKYTPLGQGGQFLQEDDRHLEHTTYTSSNHQGPMNISITYSRYSTPRTQSTMVGRMNQHWNGLATYPPTSVLKRMPLSARNPKRHRTNKDENDSKESQQLNSRTHSKSVRSSVPYYQKIQASAQMRPSIAPHSLQAETIHRLKPITSHTTLIGRGLGSHHRRHNTIGYH